jgi:hypothetical protein
MWSLKQGLIYFKNHLPSGFDSAHGIKTLFPKGYKGSISPLKGYVFAAYARLATSFNYGSGDAGAGSAADTYVMADGTGRWFFSWKWWPVNYSVTYTRTCGFVFHYSNDKNAHGYVDTSKPSENVKSCHSGTDRWIADNWPEIFKAGRHINLQDYTPPVVSQVWTGDGFGESNFTQLIGGSVHCAATVSGSTFFPYPNSPSRLVSPIALVLRTLINSAGLVIRKNLSTLKKSFTASDGLHFDITVPSGLKPDGSGTVTAKFSSVDKKTSGSYAWDFPSGTPNANGTITFDVTDGVCKIDYTYAVAAQPTGLPVSTLKYTVSITAKDKSVSSISQTIQDGLVVSQTASSTNSGGKTTSTKFTINSDGTLEVSSPDSKAGSTVGVSVLPAQKILLMDALVNPTKDLALGVLGIFPPAASPDPFTLVWYHGGDPVVDTWTDPVWGPESVTITPNYDKQGNLDVIEYSFSTGPSPSGVSISGTYFIATQVSIPPVLGSFSGSFPTANGTYTVDYTTNMVSPNQMFLDQSTYTVTTTFVAQDGSITSQSQSGTGAWGGLQNPPLGDLPSWAITSQTIWVTDPAGNASSSTVTFTSDGGFTLTITTTDTNGNGTTETISGDSQGNVQSDTTADVTGSDGSGGGDGGAGGGASSDSGGDGSGSDGGGDTGRDGGGSGG